MEQGKIDLFYEMLNDNENIDKIKRYTKFSDAKIKELIDQNLSKK